MFLGLERFDQKTGYKVMELEGRVQPAPGTIINEATVEYLISSGVKVTVH